ncbi:MAG: DUF2285 domain-containing protein [Proteobacteria bacterium]|jgi:hypothetical protein|nr:DUF2285 domain-containing protein [Pseudomonadota bacterium]
MNLFVRAVFDTAGLCLWPERITYDWMASLSSTGWAWEFLRRSPRYRLAYERDLAEPAAKPSALDWGLLRFEDPKLSALEANPFWRMKVSPRTLPLVAGAMRPGTAVEKLDLEKLQCRTTVYPLGVEDRQDVLFAQDGRFLQLAVFGSVPLAEALLLTPALPALPYCENRLLAVRRLTDLVKHRTLRPSLYQRQRRAPRLTLVAQALDGWLARASYRDIGTALFGAARVERDWYHSGNHLRDQVRRAVGYGRALANGGYTRFLA